MSKTKERFWTFFKMGAFTVGSGYAMVALLQNEFVEEKKWVTKEEFLDMVAIAESTPSIFPEISKLRYFFGADCNE